MISLINHKYEDWKSLAMNLNQIIVEKLVRWFARMT